MKKVTKGIIPCGGMGTRFLPITKAVPKEILPVVDTPVLAHIVQEFVDSGITDVMIVLSSGKQAIKEYFSPSPLLEENLIKNGKTELYELVKSIASKANITYAYQTAPRGSGDAVMLARDFTGDEPFALAWGDDLIYSPSNPVIKQLITAYEKTGKSILGVQYLETDDIVKYGVPKVTNVSNRLYKCERIIEKPALSEIPSRLASLGRYVLTPEIYLEIEKLTPVKNEIQFTDALNSLCANGVYAYDFEGKRYDMGDKLGAVKATVEYALRSEFGKQFAEYLLQLSKTL